MCIIKRVKQQARAFAWACRNCITECHGLRRKSRLLKELSL